MIIFERVPLAVSLGFFPATYVALKEIRESRKTQSSAEGVVLNQSNGRPAEFIADFEIVTPRFPSIVVDKVPIRIHPGARNRVRRADNRKSTAGDRDFRQTEVKRRCHARIQPNRRRIEIMILREETFRKTVPTETRFIQRCS